MRAGLGAEGDRGIQSFGNGTLCLVGNCNASDLDAWPLFEVSRRLSLLVSVSQRTTMIAWRILSEACLASVTCYLQLPYSITVRASGIG